MASAEVYDQVTGTWSTAGAMANARDEHTATLLQNGAVLVAGGNIVGVLSTAELYDPSPLGHACTAGAVAASASMGCVATQRAAAASLPIASRASAR
jgi:hypothetical protein